MDSPLPSKAMTTPSTIKEENAPRPSKMTKILEHCQIRGPRLTSSGVLAVNYSNSLCLVCTWMAEKMLLRRGSSVWLLLVACFLEPSIKKSPEVVV